MDENVMENDYFTLTDEEGNEIEFEMIAQCERDGEKYFAMIPVEDGDDNKDICEYIILKLAEEDGEEQLAKLDVDLLAVYEKFLNIYTKEMIHNFYVIYFYRSAIH